VRHLVILCLTACSGAMSNPPPRAPGPPPSSPRRQQASYRLLAHDRQLAAIRLTTDGAEARVSEGQLHNIIDVRLDVDNPGTAPIELDRSHAGLIGVETSTGRIAWLAPALWAGPEQVAGGTRERIVAEFWLPWDTRPQDVHTFRFQWRLTEGRLSWGSVTKFEQPAVVR
jgi:hypothetical protein